VVNATPRPLYPQGKGSGTHSGGKCVGSRDGLGGCEKSLPKPEFDPWTVQAVPSCYTDRAIQVNPIYISVYIVTPSFLISHRKATFSEEVVFKIKVYFSRK
jgi:hypothetical protein